MDEKVSDKRKRISEAGFELKKALDAWEDLNRQNLGVPADEQMLDDIQSLLKRLKTQLEDLE